MEWWTEYSRFFTALLVVTDPFAAIPVFLALTADASRRGRQVAAMTTAATVAVLLIAAALAGEALLTWMGTSLASFRVGGGLVLLLMGVAMLRAEDDAIRTSPAERREARDATRATIVPLGIPLLAGPGAISTVIIEMHRVGTAQHVLWVIAIILGVAAILGAMLAFAEHLASRLGILGLKIMNRLFGLILTAVAVEIMANGFRALFPVLSGGA